MALQMVTESLGLSQGGKLLRFCTSWPAMPEGPVLDITALISIPGILVGAICDNARILQMLGITWSEDKNRIRYHDRDILVLALDVVHGLDIMVLRSIPLSQMSDVDPGPVGGRAAH